MSLSQNIDFCSRSSLLARICTFLRANTHKQTQAGKSIPSCLGHKPFFASLLQKRRIALILFCAATLQILLISTGLQGWRCPIHSTFGIPCPGCGLSTAMSLLINGDWQIAIQTHAFAPVFLFAFSLMGIVSILPKNLHRKAVLQIAVIEKHTAFAAYILFGIIIYWIFRLLGLYWLDSL